MSQASEAYSDMLRNYRIWRRGGIDKNKAYNLFINAAQILAEQALPNPFIETALSESPVAPSAGGGVVTGVLNDDGKVHCVICGEQMLPEEKCGTKETCYRCRKCGHRTPVGSGIADAYRKGRAEMAANKE